MPVEYNCCNRAYKNGKSYDITTYDGFLDKVSEYQAEHNKYPTVRVLAELCKVSIGTARKVIEIHKGKRARTTILNENKKSVKHGNHCLDLHEEMFLLGQYFAEFIFILEWSNSPCTVRENSYIDFFNFFRNRLSDTSSYKYDART